MMICAARYKYKRQRIQTNMYENGEGVSRWNTNGQTPHPEPVLKWKVGRTPVAGKHQGRACAVYDVAEFASWDSANAASAFVAAARRAKRMVEPDPVPISTPSTVRGRASVRPPITHPVTRPGMFSYIYRSKSIRPRASDHSHGPPSSRI